MVELEPFAADRVALLWVAATGSECGGEDDPEPGLKTKITIAAITAAASTDNNTIPPARELRGASGAGRSAAAGCGSSALRVGSSPSAGSGSEASGASSEADDPRPGAGRGRGAERVANGVGLPGRQLTEQEVRDPAPLIV